ncbi:GGDEF domain-containing protein [Rhizobiaceae bacterium BDR2-2]|uniref:diguanylate cyclase n=1 Tax=Ectorhizobium quercum TaxID=2965071 RepID=A0AAE3SVF4_9HYPH|nr:GGDEF domain-containing protein [Ectorhizobium quercum]MCX8996295.1 GGDEF domain-containing protein [Ectorhizobium quercum]MCX8998666.1 GGDEF domain-containing protein [Ectorhizobium quercum]
MLELKTVFLYSAAINYCTVAAVTIGWFRSEGRSDMRFWLLAAWLMVVGNAIMALSNTLSYHAAGYIGGFVHMASMGCLLLGFKAFFGLPYHWSEAIAVPLATSGAIVLSMFVTGGAADGVWLIYFGSGANLLMTSLVVWRGKQGEVLPSRMLAIVITAIYALGNLCIAPFAYFFPLGFVDGVPQATWLEVCAIPLVICNVATYVVVLVLKLERATERQRYLATRDMLTGVLNRRAFYEAVAGLADRDGSMAVIDLDHFKAINDAHGHRGGDDALRAFARCTQATLPETAVFGRTGGEEFAICLPDFDPAATQGLLERLRKNVERMEVVSPRGGGLIPVTISCGHSAFRAGNWVMDQTIAEADSALYQAKNGGRNRVEGYAPAAWLQRCIEDTLAALGAATRR